MELTKLPSVLIARKKLFIGTSLLALIILGAIVTYWKFEHNTISSDQVVTEGKSDSDFAMLPRNAIQIAPGIFRDDHAVYIYNVTSSEYSELETIEGADPATFAVLSDPTFGSNSTFAKDKSAVYALSGGYNPDVAVTKIQDIDPETFKVIGHCLYPAQPSGPYGHGYAGKDSTHVVVNVPFGEPEIVSAADPATFKIVGEIPTADEGLAPPATVYAVDKNHVYRSCSEIIQGLSPTQCTVTNLNGCEVSTKNP